jgi:SAM-dependent methyltransferase
MSSEPRVNTIERHWPDVARRWNMISSPLRPVQEDLQSFRKGINTIQLDNKLLRALILGVTPEFYAMLQPLAGDLVAVDHTQQMIDCVWPGPINLAILAEWTDMPLPARSRDVVVCDGGLHLLSHPTGQMELVRSLARVVVPGGLFIVRLFVPPFVRQAPDVVLEQLLNGEIANLNVLKLRLGMSLQQTSEEGVELGSVWNALHAVAPDLDKLAQQLSWSAEHLHAIDTYRDSSNRYYFVSAETVVRMFCTNAAGFELMASYTPTYELGEQCPTLIFRRCE